VTTGERREGEENGKVVEAFEDQRLGLFVEEVKIVKEGL